MNMNQMKTNELALLLHGLRAIIVTEEEAVRQRLMSKIEVILATRGVSLGE
jgi:hypothetical protein